jgi:glutamate carboxypeptidase
MTSLPAQAIAEARRVHAAARTELDVMLADLERWVTMDSPGGDVDSLDRLAAEIADRLVSFGLVATLVERGGRGASLVATLEGSGHARVALIGHHDTVFPRGTAARRPLALSSTRCTGPGVADMKGGLVVAAHAARLLATGSRPFAKLELVSWPDEESRPTAPPTLDRLRGVDAVLCLECGRPDGAVVSARKGALWFRIAAKGRAAHAGVDPEVGRNAVHAIAQEAVRLQALHGARPGLTLHVTGLEGGEGLNTVPSRASLTGDVRGLTGADLAWAREQILAFPAYDGIELSFDDLGGPPPFERTARVAALAATAISLGAELGQTFGEASTGGVSDGSWTAHAGIPTLDGLGPVGGLDHGPDEYIETETLASRCGVVAGLVAAIDAAKRS